MAATYIVVSNTLENALCLEGDNRTPAVDIPRAGTANINIKDVIGNVLLCNTLSTWVTSGTVTVTRGGTTVTAAQLTAYKQGADMDRVDYDTDDDNIIDRAEQIDASSRTAVTVAMSPYTVLATDTVLQTASTTGTIGLTLPAGVDGKTYTIMDGSGSAGLYAITVTPDGAETINGAATYVIDSAYQAVSMYYDAASTDWKVTTLVLGAGRSVDESWQHTANTETLRLFRARSAGTIRKVAAEVGTAAAAGESMTFDVEIGGVSCLTGVITVDNAVAIDTPVAGTVDTAANTFAAGDLIRVVRVHTPGGAPTPMLDTVCTVEYQIAP